jgi:putative hemolysin
MAMQSVRQPRSPVADAFSATLAGGTPAPVRAFIHSALQLARLEKLYADATTTDAPGELTDKVLASLGVSVVASEADCALVPKTGPVVVVANHPFGLLDGLMLDAVLHRIRPDVRILANAVLCLLPELSERFFPVEVFRGDASSWRNATSLRAALAWLERGGVVAMFPAGEVAHWDFRASRVQDPQWSTLAARLPRIAGAAVVPAYFEGSNSVAFHLAGLIHPMLRTASLPRELVNKRGNTFTLRFGSPVSAAAAAKHADDRSAADYLRARSHLLGHRASTPQPPVRRHHFPSLRRPVSPAGRVEPASILREIAELDRCGARIVENREFTVYVADGARAEALVYEIGRLREETFRAAGEGTGKALDLDSFDETYQHVILWDKSRGELAGAYRLTETEPILARSGVSGLYTSTLFHYDRRFFERLGPAVELGRSFIVRERQKEFAPLLMLWQGIFKTVARRAVAPVVFGAVSISKEYGAASQEMMIEFLRKSARKDLAELAHPRRPFRQRLTRCDEIRTIGQLLRDISDLNAPIRDVDSRNGVPVLLRQYLKLGGEVVAFNVDPRFSDVVDCLLLVDLRKTDRALLDKYMGSGDASSFLAHWAPPASFQPSVMSS